MDLMGAIADTTIERLKKDKRFENWSDEKFSRLRDIMTVELDTEEDAEKLVDTLSELLMEEDEKK